MTAAYYLDDSELSKSVLEMEATEFKLDSVNKVLEKWKSRGLISGYDITSLESFHKQVLSERSLRSYTEGYSKTNLSYAIENSERLATALKVGLVVGFATFIANFVLWLIAGKSMSEGGGGSSISNLDPLADVRRTYMQQEAMLAPIRERMNEAIRSLNERVANRKDFDIITKIMLKNVIDGNEVFKESDLHGLTLNGMFDCLVSESVIKASKPLIINLFRHDSNDVKMLTKACDLVTFGFENLQRDLQKIKEAYDHGAAPQHLSDIGLFVEKLKHVAKDCGVKESDDVNEMAKGISDHIHTGLTGTASNSIVKWSELATNGFGNILRPIEDMIKVEEKIHDEAKSMEAESKAFHDLVEAGNHSASDKVMYQEAIKNSRTYSVAFGVVLNAIRNIQRHLRFLELCVDRAINKLIRILKKSESTINESVDIKDDAAKHAAAVSIKETIQMLNEAKSKKPKKRG